MADSYPAYHTPYLYKCLHKLQVHKDKAFFFKDYKLHFVPGLFSDQCHRKHNVCLLDTFGQLTWMTWLDGWAVDLVDWLTRGLNGQLVNNELAWTDGQNLEAKSAVNQLFPTMWTTHILIYLYLLFVVESKIITCLGNLHQGKFQSCEPFIALGGKMRTESRIG